MTDENITYARGRVVELEADIKENTNALNAIKRDILRELNSDFDTDLIRDLLNKADLFLFEIKKSTTDLNAIKTKWGFNERWEYKTI